MTSPITTPYNWPQSYSSSTGSTSQASAVGSTSSTTPNCPAGSQTGSAATQINQPQNLQQIFSALASILQILIQSLSSSTGAAPTGTTAPPTTTGGSSNTPTQPAPQTASTLGNAAAQRNTTTDPNQKQRLNNTLAAIAQDPEGSKLLKAALDKGYTIQVGNLDANTNGDTLPDQKKIIISPNAPNFTKTVVHELVHAATDQDGDSKDEEGKADVIGFRVASRILGQPEPNEQATYRDKVTNPAYGNLQANNNVDQALAALGLTAFSA